MNGIFRRTLFGTGNATDIPAFTETTATNNYHDERYDIDNIFTSWIGIIITTISSVISIAASVLVICIIHRSIRGLTKSVYHRILFGMSASDILISIGFGTTTLFMPTDMLYTNYDGLIIGNHHTCTAQGSIIALAGMAGLMYNAMLSIYYLCSIKYQMTDEIFSRRLEPMLHIVTFVFALTVTALLSAFDSFYPSPNALSWCGISAYPYWCDGSDCLNDLTTGMKMPLYMSFLIALSSFVIIIFSMVSIVIAVYKQDQRRLKDIDPDTQGTTPAVTTNSVQRRVYRQTKIITRQAFAYTIVNSFGFMIGVFYPFIRNSAGIDTPSTTFQILYLILRPLQGLFNAIIFIHHKISSLQRTNTTLNFFDAFRAALKGFEGDDQPLSDMIPVRRHSALSRLRLAHWDSTSMNTPADGPYHRVEENDLNRTPENSVVPSVQTLSGFSQVPYSDAVSLNEDLMHARSKGVDGKDHVVNESIDV